jgi:predicted glycosyltransferase
MKKKILFYFTHKESLGHTTRILSIIHSLLDKYKNKVEISIFQAGKKQTFLKKPDGVRWFDLPRPYYSKLNFKSGSSQHFVPLYAKLRAVYMLKKLAEIKPDIFITEFFPFGRESSRFELFPVLKYLKLRKIKIYASIGYPYIVRSNMRLLFYHCDLYDRFFIHTPYDLEFKYMSDDIDNLFLKTLYLKTFQHIKSRVTYTGYILPFNVRPKETSSGKEHKYKKQGKKLILVSRGGGVRYPKIIVDSILAATHLSQNKFHFVIAAGPATTKKQMSLFGRLIKDRRIRNISLYRYIENLPSYIKNCDVSVSMSGYNTSVQLLYFKKPSVIIPSNEDPETAAGYCSEQISRAKLLKDHIDSRIVHYLDLSPRILAEAIEKVCLERKKKPNRPIPHSWFSGDDVTAKLIFHD